MKLFHLKLKLHRVGHGIKRIPNKHKFSGLIIFLVIVSAVYGLSLRSKAEDNTANISGTKISDITTTPIVYDGVSIHTKIENISGTPATNPLFNTATVKRGQVPPQQARITLTVNNGGTAKTTDVKFTLPAGFAYTAPVSGGAPTTTPCPGITSPVAGDLYWCGYNAVVGQSQIVFTATLP